MKRDSLAGRKGRVIARTSSDPTDVLRAVFCALADIPDVEWRFFRAHIRERQFRPREHLVREGQTHSHLFYVVSGLVRNYHNDEDGELVRGFGSDGDVMSRHMQPVSLQTRRSDVPGSARL